nr:MAG TPA: hypothetical protein [Caudoviricetes sp.]
MFSWRLTNMYTRRNRKRIKHCSLLDSCRSKY